MVKGIASKPEDLTSVPRTRWHRESAAFRDEWRWGGPAELGGEYSHSIGIDYHLYTSPVLGTGELAVNSTKTLKKPVLIQDTIFVNI